MGGACAGRTIYERAHVLLIGTASLQAFSQQGKNSTLSTVVVVILKY